VKYKMIWQQRVHGQACVAAKSATPLRMITAARCRKCRYACVWRARCGEAEVLRACAGVHAARHDLYSRYHHPELDASAPPAPAQGRHAWRVEHQPLSFISIAAA